MASCKPARSAFPPTDSHWLSPHRSRFLESLTAQGYAVRTVKSFRLMVGRLCAEAEARGLVPNTLDANVMRELADACPRTGTSYMERELAMATRRFTAYLVHVGVIAPTTPTPPPLGSPEQLCAELDHWLRNHQGMFGNRLRVYRKVMQRIIGFCCTATGTAEDLAAITPEAVFAFLDGYAGRAGWRLPYVRNILRFLFWSGRTPRDLSGAIRGDSARALAQWLPERAGAPHEPLFASNRKRRFSRDGIERIVRKYARLASATCPSLARKRVSPHTLRHYIDERTMSGTMGRMAILNQDCSSGGEHPDSSARHSPRGTYRLLRKPSSRSPGL